MNAREKLIASCERTKSLVCIGLDIDPKRVPKICGEGIKGMFQFALKIIAATSDVAAAYKPNMGFFEALGPEGLSLLKHIISRIPPEAAIILDAKRGDIGNTSEFYARTVFDIYKADWTTVNPYLGFDSIKPFLDRKDKGAFILCLTSNPGAQDFQWLQADQVPLYLHVARKAATWNTNGNCGLVVGATYPEQISAIREAAGDMPFLIPGIGAQGGDLEKAVRFGTANFTRPAVINVSRGVLYASEGEDFDRAARAEVVGLNEIINRLKKSPA
ncbi:MAG: orotidine-5'-phosphate decarboxylase [candidate division Zixibacteria bacterium]|nr:orotidine-5'-phosphate decarboxylase [candidate division Zixibacteria bacterium]